MTYQQLPGLANAHVAELRQVAAAQHRSAAQAHAVARLRPSLRARAGWLLVKLGLSLAYRAPGSRQLRAG